ncbi:hypothetical protein EDB84DRAFT_558748 [Lactarius hengduanensis]|nr:hypothetical protein EDB84DRAFT_558748 [Lactarius hengduanensis]
MTVQLCVPVPSRPKSLLSLVRYNCQRLTLRWSQPPDDSEEAIPHHPYPRQCDCVSSAFGPYLAHSQVDVGEWRLHINKDELRSVLSRLHITNISLSPLSVAAHNYPVPVDLLVVGTVPAGCGLSSSTVVVTLTLAFLAANNGLGNVRNRAAVEMGKRETCRSK